MKVVSKQTNSKHCLICGIENQFGLAAPFYNLQDGRVATIFSFKFEHQSYPERVHGGMICTMLDELAGRALWAKNPNLLGVTVNMSVKFRKVVPYNKKLLGVGEIVSMRGKIFVAKAKILDEEKNVLAESEGTYMILPQEKIADAKHFHIEDVNIFVPDDVQEIDV